MIQHPRAAAGRLGSSSGHPRRSAVVDAWLQSTATAPDENRTFRQELCSKASQLLQEEIRREATNLNDSLVKWRRTLHRVPELMYQEKQTSHYIQQVLGELDISYSVGWGRNTRRRPLSSAKNSISGGDVNSTTTDEDIRFIEGPGGYGVVTDLGTGEEPCVLLRADIDALPILEQTSGVEEFASQNKGRMHACGHDGHTAMLLGAAAVLKSMEGSIPGTVRLVFQPAEEGGAGAKRMIEEGVLSQKPRVSHAFAMHVWPTLPSGTVGGRPGPLLAACERFELVIQGIGGHAAMPHLTADPIVAGSAVVVGLQTIVSRFLSPLESAVVSVTEFHAGSNAYNVIPPRAVLRGTIRALDTAALLNIRERVERVASSVADAHGCRLSDIQYSPDYYPPTVNDPELYNTFSEPVASMLLAKGRVREVEPTMGAEDFAFFAEAVPSTFFLLGQGGNGSASECALSSGKRSLSGEGYDPSEDRGSCEGDAVDRDPQHPPTSYGLHHPCFALDESILSLGVELHVNLALRCLKALGKRRSPPLPISSTAA